MKKTLFVCCALALTLGAQAQWKPVGDKIKTPWAEQVNPAMVRFWSLLLSNPLFLAYRKKLAKTANYGINVLFPFLQPGKIRTSC